jgi:hypothetical protein
VAEFEIDGVEYISTKMDAKTQVKLLKRLAPLLPAIRSVAVLMASSDAGEGQSNQDEAFKKLVDGLHEISDDDLDFVIDETLSLVKVKEKGGWAPVWSRAAGRAMNEDAFGIEIMFPCIARVIQAEFGRFFPTSA